MNGTLTEWDVRTGEIVKTLKGHQDGVLEFIILDKLLVSGSDDGYCMVFKIRE